MLRFGRITARRVLAIIALTVLSLLILRISQRPLTEDAAIEIILMYPRGSLTGAIERVIAEFESDSRRRHQTDPSQPVWKVIAGQHAERSGVARFVLATSGGAPPDVYFAERAISADWIARGAFQPLDEFILRDEQSSHEGVSIAARHYPGCWRSVTNAGQVYALPLGLGNTALLYNKALFEAAGLVHADGPQKGQARPPETWEELRDAARRLTAWESGPVRRPKVAGFLPLHGAGSLELYCALADHRLVDDSGRICQLNQPAAIDALRFIVDLHDDQGGVAAIRGMNLGPAGSPADPFINGNVAMKIDYQWVVNWQAALAPSMRFGVAPIPGPRGPSKISWGTGWQVSIPRNSRNPDGAWALIRFLASERGQLLLAETQRRFTEANGRIYVPTQTPVPRINELLAARYVRDNAKLSSDVRDGFDLFDQMLEGVEFSPISPAASQLASAQTIATEQSLFGTPPDVALNEAAQSVQRVLDRAATPRGVMLPSIETLLAVSLIFVMLVTVLFAVAGHYKSSTSSAAPFDEIRAGYWFASPWLSGFLIFTAAPIVLSLLLSFCDFDVPGTPRWIFLANYREVLLDDSVVRRALVNTLIMSLVVPISLTISLAIALLIHTAPGRSFWQSMFYLPVVVPLTASAAAWAWFLNLRGPVNQVLSYFGTAGPDWLNDPMWSKPAIAIVILWGCGGSIVVWLASLQNIPLVQYEAASLDGARPWARFWHITWPHLRPALRFNLLAGLITVLHSFGEAYIMTAGGPNQSSLYLNQVLFETAFSAGRMGAACALAWVVFMAAAGLMALQFGYLVRRRTQP